MATRWAVLSDIHGNLEALDAVLADAAAQNVEKIAVLGDVIDYGPDPYQGCRRNHVHTFVGPKAVFFVPDAPCVIHEIAAARMAVNVGSVGQPRRLGDNRASYVLYDGQDLEFRRVEYDWMKTASKLAKLPIDGDEQRALIERLETGI
jgi:predicted phosphodiesterase